MEGDQVPVTDASEQEPTPVGGELDLPEIHPALKSTGLALLVCVSNTAIGRACLLVALGALILLVLYQSVVGLLARWRGDNGDGGI